MDCSVLVSDILSLLLLPGYDDDAVGTVEASNAGTDVVVGGKNTAA
jgi:hypothetical protein